MEISLLPQSLISCGKRLCNSTGERAAAVKMQPLLQLRQCVHRGLNLVHFQRGVSEFIVESQKR